MRPQHDTSTINKPHTLVFPNMLITTQIFHNRNNMLKSVKSEQIVAQLIIAHIGGLKSQKKGKKQIQNLILLIKGFKVKNKPGIYFSGPTRIYALFWLDNRDAIIKQLFFFNLLRSKRRLVYIIGFIARFIPRAINICKVFWIFDINIDV